MSDQFMGELRIVSFGFAPKFWALADGQLLPINQNQGLFALYGTMYGGDGRTTFALPNLQGRVPIHFGQGFSQGQLGGETAHTLTSQEMPVHNHQVVADTTLAPAADGNVPSSTRRLAASRGGSLYGPPNNAQAMNAATVGSVGGSQAHDNMAPYLALSIIVAIQGVFPSQN